MDEVGARTSLTLPPIQTSVADALVVMMVRSVIDDSDAYSVSDDTKAALSTSWFLGDRAAASPGVAVGSQVDDTSTAALPGGRARRGAPTALVSRALYSEGVPTPARKKLVKHAAPKKRVRRDAEESKSLLLDAAERVFAAFLPDEVGLKEIAKEAGVSHALIGHHFGTYESIVEATLSRRLDALRTRALEGFASIQLTLDGDPPLVDILIELMSDRLSMRLMAWSILSGHSARHDHLFPRTTGLRLIADVIDAGLRARSLHVNRQSIDYSVASGLAMAIGFGIAGPSLQRALGKTEPFDPRTMRRDMADMTRGFIMLAARRTMTES